MKLGLPGLRSLWLIALLFPSMLCYVNEDAIPAEASWPLIAREDALPDKAYLFP